MNLTELSQAVTVEMEAVQQQHQSLKREVVSLTATIASLKSSVETQESYLARLQKKSQEETEQLNHLRNQLTTERDKQTADLQELSQTTYQHLQTLKEESESQLKETKHQALRIAQDIEERKSALTEREQLLRDDEERLTTISQAIFDKEIGLTSRENGLQDKIDADAASQDLRMLEIEKRLERLAVDERLMAERKAELAKREKGIRETEEQLTLTKETSKKQSEKALALSDTYERRLAGLEEKEKALRVREIRLSDRESVALSHGTS